MLSKKHYNKGIVPVGQTSLTAKYTKNCILFLTSLTSLSTTITMSDRYHNIEDRILKAIYSLDN